MRLLVVGCHGQVGFELVRALQPLGEVVAWTRAQADLQHPTTFIDALDKLQPDVIVNAGAYTAVDAAESDEATAHCVNAEAPGALGAWASRCGASLVHFSTDYVFDGRGDRPWRETDPVWPINAYGRTKAAGETAIAMAGGPHLILRTSWVYATRGRNFLLTMLRLARERTALRVVNDQFGAPTWARAIAESTAAILARAGSDRSSVARSFAARGGVFHLTCAGQTSWFDFARQTFELVPDPLRQLERLEPIPTSQFPTAAKRPRYSVLDSGKLAELWGIRLPSWEDCLRTSVEDWSP